MSELRNSLDLVLEQKRKATEEIKSYFDAKQELDIHKLTINVDFQKFAKIVNCIAEFGYEPESVLAEFQDIQYTSRKGLVLEIAIDEMKKDLAKLKQQDHTLRQAINMYYENLFVYN